MPPSTLPRLDQATLEIAARKHEMFRAARLGGARAVLAYHDLSGLSLVGRDFSHADLTGCDLMQAAMANSKFDYAIMFGANMTGCDLHGASLVRADLRGVCLRGANLVDADMTGADLREKLIGFTGEKEASYASDAKPRPTDTSEADLSGANLTQSRLSGITAINSNFRDAILKDSTLVHADLQGANFCGANLENSDLTKCDLRGAQFHNAILVDANLEKANLQQADLAGALTNAVAGATLQDLPLSVDAMLAQHRMWVETNGQKGKQIDISRFDLRRTTIFRHAKLTMMQAREAILYGVDFTESELQAADFQGADLRSASFARADLRGSRFQKALFNSANLQGVRFQPLILEEGRVLMTDLTECSFRYANLSGANLDHVKLTGADLTGANLVGCDLTDVDLTGVTLIGARLTPAQEEVLLKAQVKVR